MHEEEWYNQAFGKKRNLMRLDMALRIPEGTKFTSKLLFFAEIQYQMFPEMEREFRDAKYPNVITVELIDEDELGLSYEAVIELPFGTVDAKLKYREENSEDKKLQEPLKHIADAFKTNLEPVPISMAQQAERDKLEEEENKKKEQEARAAQEKLEAEKARLRQEQMLQIQKQEANANKLLVYTKAMTLSFHEVRF
jgi:hypothetical protein